MHSNQTLYDQMQKVREHQLSVILDEESQYFDESELDSEFGDQDAEGTLEEGKKSSRKTKSKK